MRIHVRIDVAAITIHEIIVLIFLEILGYAFKCFICCYYINSICRTTVYYRKHPNRRMSSYYWFSRNVLHIYLIQKGNSAINEL